MNAISSACTSRSIVSACTPRRAGRTPPSLRRRARRSPGSRRAAARRRRGSRPAAGRGERADPAVRLEPVHDLALHRERHPRSARTSGAQAPGQTRGGRPRTCRRRWSPGRRRRRPPTPAPAPSNRSSAPRRAASSRCAVTVSSGRTNPATSSYSPTSSSAGVIVGNRRRISPASRTSCGRSHSWAALRLPATVALRPAQVEAAGLRHQVAAGVGLQLLPQLVGPPQQRHVGRVLEVGLPDDPRPAVAGSLVVRRAEALQAEHPRPRPARWAAAALPMPPSPSTITS